MKDDPRARLDGHIIVWIASVSTATDSLTSLESHLSGAELERAGRFRFPEDRARFVLGRGLLRVMLGRYRGQPPQEIGLGTTNRGRPILPDDETYQFSVSHSGDLVALALTVNGQVGIDLEYMQPDFGPHDLAERVFSKADLQSFRTLPRHLAPPAFFRAWTRKEAYLKARGEGIAEALPQVSVSFGPEEPASIKDGREASTAHKWRLWDLPLPADYMGSVAWDGAGKRVECSHASLNAGQVVLEKTLLSPSE